MQPFALATEVARALSAFLPSSAGLSVQQVTALLAPPPDKKMGDLAFPCFQLAKAMRNAPAKIAQSLAAEITAKLPCGPLTEVTAAGPYLNLRLDTPLAAQIVLAPWARGETPSFPARAEKVMIEYSQPNTHKAFHIGHMRNVCLGDCLVRLQRAIGHEVIAANYLGDVGTHIAKCLWGLEQLEGDAASPPKEGRGEWLGKIYTHSTETLTKLSAAAKEGDAPASAALEAAKSRMTEILKAVEAGDPKITKLWRETRQWSLDEFNEIYRWADIHFDRVFYESEVDKPSLALVDEYLAKGVFTRSEGAIGIENPEVKHMPFFLLRKRDGTGLYSTKDLALARMKFDEFHVDRSLYVVDARQSDHFRHVFLTLQKMGFEKAAQCAHVAYEMVEGPDGPFSSREGNVILFRELREGLRAKAAADLRDRESADNPWSDEDLDATCRMLSLGAIKYGMLNRDVNQKIVFKMQDWMEPAGNTGTYQQYSAARALSVLRKAKNKHGKELDARQIEEKATPLGAEAFPSDSERALISAINALSAAVLQAGEQLRPTILCAATHKLAQAYNTFQNDPKCNVIHSEGDVLQGRLMLVTAARSAMRWGLSLMGIPAPERI